MRCGLLEHQERMNFMTCKLIYGLSGPYPELTGVTGQFQDIRDNFRKGIDSFRRNPFPYSGGKDPPVPVLLLI